MGLGGKQLDRREICARHFDIGFQVGILNWARAFRVAFYQAKSG
jgi:hypothetical protein